MFQSHSEQRSMKTVDIVVYPGFKALEAIGPMSVFEYANLHLRQAGRPPGYDVCIASTAVGPVQSDTLMSLHATKALNTLALPDDAIIVGARDIRRALADGATLVDWVGNACGRLRRLAALCSGTFFLAAAGVLDGKRATTHWSVADRLQDDYPAIQVEADAIFIRADNLWTSAGVTAGIDLALALVEDDFGRDLALRVATDMVVYLKRPGGQSQFSTHLLGERTARPGIRDIVQWIQENLHERRRARAQGHDERAPLRARVPAGGRAQHPGIHRGLPLRARHAVAGQPGPAAEDRRGARLLQRRGADAARVPEKARHSAGAVPRTLRHDGRARGATGPVMMAP